MQAYVRILFLFIVSGALSLAIYYGAEHGWGRLAPIELKMDSTSNQKRLFQRIESSLNKELKPFVNQWVWDVPLSQVLSKVESDRRVDSAQVRRVFPNRLEVQIKPREPVLAWLDEAGRIFPVSADGVMLPVLPLNETSDLPLLRGKEFKTDLELREKTIAMYLTFPKEGRLSQKTISEFQFSKRNGLSLTLVQSGVEIKFGEDELQKKIDRVERVLNYLEDQQLKGRVIDATLSKKVVVRLRNAP